MILTGKALEHFNNWYWSVWLDNKERDFYGNKDMAIVAIKRTDPIFLHALIIEWFDSVGIYIEFGTTRLNKGKFDYTIKGYRPHAMDHSFKFFKNRTKATRQAIIKANEIYNEKVES